MAEIGSQVAAGEHAPDSVVKNERGADVLLSACWRERPAVFVFVRHFG